MVAEIDEVAAGERASGLLQPAAGCETTQVDGRKAEALDQAHDKIVRLRVIPRDEDNAPTAVLYGAFIEARGDDRVERLDNPRAKGTGEEPRPSLAPLPPRSANTRPRTLLNERIRCIYEYSAVPGGQPPQRVLDV